jgi:hypothetical protein
MLMMMMDVGVIHLLDWLYGLHYQNEEVLDVLK